MSFQLKPSCLRGSGSRLASLAPQGMLSWDTFPTPGQPHAIPCFTLTAEMSSPCLRDEGAEIQGCQVPKVNNV